MGWLSGIGVGLSPSGYRAIRRETPPVCPLTTLIKVANSSCERFRIAALLAGAVQNPRCPISLWVAARDELCNSLADFHLLVLPCSPSTSPSPHCPRSLLALSQFGTTFVSNGARRWPFDQRSRSTRPKYATTAERARLTARCPIVITRTPRRRTADFRGAIALVRSCDGRY